MSVLKKTKKADNARVLTDNYVPAALPTYGFHLENFVTTDYPMNQAETIEAVYGNTAAQLEGIINTCDHHSDGSECDPYIDAEIKHIVAIHEDAIAHNENQNTRILTAREMRKADLSRKIDRLKEKTETLKAEIKPLEGLRSQFQISFGKHTVSAGLLVTVLSMIVDAAVNYSFLQNVLLTNFALLFITVACMSVMSDGSMWALGLFLSRRRETFTSKPMFWAICIGLGSMFVLSVISSVMVRFGSMDATFGTINAAGEFVGKDTYSLAEYGTTLVTAFVTTATGVLSFAFSLDENEFLVTIREGKKRELVRVLAEMDLMVNELALIENAPDPRERDHRKRIAAEQHLKATNIGLKLLCRKLMALRVNDPDFTERMRASGERLVASNANPGGHSAIPSAETNTINLDKVC